VRQICGQILARFCPERAAKRTNFLKLCSPPLILCNSRKSKYYTFVTHSDTEKNFQAQKVKISQGVGLFSQWPNFSARLAGKFCQDLATLHDDTSDSCTDENTNAADKKILYRPLHSQKLESRISKGDHDFCCLWNSCHPTSM
jgi:hypothetical protein